MPIEIVRHGPAHRSAVEDFNARMRSAGSAWGWYTEEDDWLPQRSSARVWREHYLAVEDGAVVRGAYALKRENFWLRGELRKVCDYQGPVSEGSVDPRHNMVAVRLLRDMQKRSPLLYSWGHGGDDPLILQMLGRLGWWIHATPLCMYSVRPGRVLAEMRHQFDGALGGRALDWLHATRTGALAIAALHAARALRRPAQRGLASEEIQRFESWADELWLAARERYSLVAVRDAETLNTVLPPGRWPPAIRLRITRDGRCVGWACVLDTQMRADRRFGNLRVGSLVDCFARPEDAPDVVLAAHRTLCARGVDLIVSNQAHPAWIAALARCGYLVFPERRSFAASPELKRALEPVAESAARIHLTNMDGHGPHAL